jgi:hypothetical protein
VDHDEIEAQLGDHEERIVGLEETWDPWAERIEVWGKVGRFSVRAVKWIVASVIAAGALAVAIQHLRP